MAITTPDTPSGWSPDQHTFAPTDVVPDALILQTSTVAGRIEGDEPVLRVAYLDDDTAQFVAEGDEIPEGDPDLGEVSLATGKVAQLVRISHEQYTQSSAAGMLSESVRRAVVKRANEAYISQPAPTGGSVTPPAGLLNIDGIEDGGEVASNLDTLVDIMAGISQAGGQPTHVLLSPSAWASLRKIKSAEGSAVSLLGAGSVDSAPALLGVPTLVSSAIPADSGMVIDRSAIVSAVGDVRVATSDQVYFSSDSVGLRCTWRFGAGVVRPERLATFTVAADTEGDEG